MKRRRELTILELRRRPFGFASWVFAAVLWFGAFGALRRCVDGVFPEGVCGLLVWPMQVALVAVPFVLFIDLCGRFIDLFPPRASGWLVIGIVLALCMGELFAIRACYVP